MHTELEQPRHHVPVVRRAAAGLVLVIAAVIALKLVIGFVVAILWTVVAVAVVVAVLWAIKTIVW